MDRTQPVMGKSRKVVFEIENKKLMVSASVVSFLFLVTIINSSILSTSSEEQLETRSIASANSISGLERNTSWERYLADSLSKKGTFHDLASLGRKPTKMEVLTMGILHSHYLVSFRKGKLHEITLSERKELAEPRMVDTEKLFNTNYLSLFPGNPVKVELSSSKNTDEGREELLTLINDSGLKVSKVTLTKDLQGKLISMNIQDLSEVQ